MTVARLYSNENFPFPVVELLRLLGHDVVTILDRGRAGEGVSDTDVLRLATAEGRAVLTLNRKDFFRLHRDDTGHAGIVACKVDPEFVGMARRIHDSVIGSGDLAGQLIRVNRLPA
jgi:Domain of unknown function (DUF5615)